MIDPMKTMKKGTLTTLLCVAVLAAGCGDPVPPAAPTPAAPSTTATFSGTLNVAGANSHPFPIAQVGGVKVILTSLQGGAAVGLGVGTPSTTSGTCLVINGITAVAGASVQISGTATVVGNFCVSVYDVGNLVEPVNYTVTVNHS
jgi:hypothetical protein